MESLIRVLNDAEITDFIVMLKKLKKNYGVVYVVDFDGDWIPAEEREDRKYKINDLYEKTVEIKLLIKDKLGKDFDLLPIWCKQELSVEEIKIDENFTRKDFFVLGIRSMKVIQFIQFCTDNRR